MEILDSAGEKDACPEPRIERHRVGRHRMLIGGLFKLAMPKPGNDRLVLKFTIKKLVPTRSLST